MRVRAGRVTTLPVAGRHLRRDDVLEPEDIAYVTDTVWGPPPVEGELIAEPGWRVRRNVRMGAPLIPPVVMPPPLIELGDRVEVIWQRGPVAISIEGTATHSAKLGDQVRIRLIDGRGTVRGVAVAPGRAEMETRKRAS
jgi:flagella basal body P-ring formation protein FlgA